jgi:DNA-binding NtrC family response regulator
VVICDLLMPGRTGLQVLVACRGRGCCPPFILMTGFADEDTRAEAMRLGAMAVLDKPFVLDAIRRILGRPPSEARGHPPVEAGDGVGRARA